MIIEPTVEVYDVENVTPTPYGVAGKIALIGAFPSLTFNMGVFTDAGAAKNAVKGEYKVPGDDNPNKTVVPTDYTAFYCLDYIFSSNADSNGPESVLIVNTNYDKLTLVTSTDNESLAAATQRLLDENFDILTIAEPIRVATTATKIVEETEVEYTILNPVLSTIKTFYNTMYRKQQGFGIISGFDFTGATGLEGETVDIIGDFKKLFKGKNDTAIYKAVSTKVKFNGAENSLNIAQSGCWHAAYTAGLNVNQSETNKEYAGLVGEVTKDNFPINADISYEDLISNGFHTTKYSDRLTQKIKCINNVTPAGYDMKIERIKNYIVKRITASNYLGENNIGSTYDALEGMLETEKQIAISSDYLIDMIYEIVPVETDVAKIKLKLVIPDIFRKFILEVAVEISMYTGE